MLGKTKAFWLQVKEEYQPTSLDPFICETSETFAADFNLYVGEYKAIAAEFLEGYKTKDFWQFGKWVLFSHVHKDYTRQDYKKIRKDFIDWCIAKFD
jgi:hypothetical protein